MLDIKFIRENPDLVKENMSKKFRQDVAIVDKLLVLDEEHRKFLIESQHIRAKRNILSEQINKLKKEGKDASAVLQQVKQIPITIREYDEKLASISQELRTLQKQIPNIMHPDVPIGKNDTENKEVKVIGKPKKFTFEPKTHQEIAAHLGIADFDSAAQTSGNGFYYLQGDLALLNQALLHFAIDTMVKHGFTYVETPLMLRKDVIANVVDLNDQENQIYKIEGEDLYLIGTSEHSLIGRYINATIPAESLPITQTSYSMCFRKEKGSHGIDERGLYRTHQFNKVEMVVICDPKDSMKHYEKMKSITIDIFKKLEIPVRVLAICSGDLGNLKHIQVDIEAWSPRRKAYFEVVSCSNLTEAQARMLGIKAATKSGEKFVPHTLNNTVIATSRALVAILENNQTKEGDVTIPKVLIPYMYGKKKLGKM